MNEEDKKAAVEKKAADKAEKAAVKKAEAEKLAAEKKAAAEADKKNFENKQLYEFEFRLEAQGKDTQVVKEKSEGLTEEAALEVAVSTLQTKYAAEGFVAAYTGSFRKIIKETQ